MIWDWGGWAMLVFWSLGGAFRINGLGRDIYTTLKDDNYSMLVCDGQHLYFVNPKACLGQVGLALNEAFRGRQ